MEKTLDRNRFIISPESLGNMRLLRTHFEIASNIHPAFMGIGFFGSRVINMQRADKYNPSDVDMAVFFDGGKVSTDPSDLSYFYHRYGEYFEDEDYSMLSLQATKCKAFRKVIEKHFGKVMCANGLPIEIDSHGHNKTVIAIDASKKVTDYKVEQFVEHVNAKTANLSQPLIVDDMNIDIFTLAARFFLGVGEGLMLNRAYILDSFRTMPQGNVYCDALMRYLQHIERTMPTNKRGPLLRYEHYPQDIMQASVYFGAQKMAVRN